MIRRLLGTALLVVALPLAAQQPPKLEPLPAPPPPPPGLAPGPALEPQVTITHRGENKVEEYRINGKIYAMKVIPPHGPPYYLIDETGDGIMSRVNSLDSGLRVPQWVIRTF